MSNRFAGRLGIVGLALCAGMAQAQRGPSPRPSLAVLTMDFAVPQGVDPITVLTFTNLNTPLSTQGNNLILPNGVELHGQLPSAQDVTQVLMKFVFPGAAHINTFAPSPWQNWTTTLVDDPNVTYGYCLTFTAVGPVGQSGGSAPINDKFPFLNGTSFAGLGISITNDPNGVETRAFGNSTVFFSATVGGVSRVPEPGTLALLSGLMVAGSTLALRRRHRA